MDKEMMRALEADGEKLRGLTGEDHGPFTDCGTDGCGECDVCLYLEFLEYAGQVAPAGSTIERNPEIEKHLDATAPGWRK